jgi:HEPN domain-containing protein
MTILREEKRMNKEYLAAKAELCSNLAQEQLTNGDTQEGVKNLKRMIRALEEINLINYLEERRGL